MKRTEVCRVLAIGVLLALAAPMAAAQRTEQYYSGGFEWSETLIANDSSGENSLARNRSLNITMTIDEGDVMCYGSVNETSQQWYAGRLEEDSVTHGDMDGIGLISIEFSEGGIHSVGAGDVELDDDVPSYNITVSCPSPTMTSTGGGETVTTPSAPAEWGSSWEIQTYDWEGKFLQPTLSGSATWNHPATDPVNGVSGTVTVKWNLVKQVP